MLRMERYVDQVHLSGGKRTNKKHSILVDPDTLLKTYWEVETPVNE